MENYHELDDFQPQTEEERIWVEQYTQLSKFISGKVRELPEDQRLATVREVNPSDTMLMSLYIQSVKKEDYETSKVAKDLLAERGITPK